MANITKIYEIKLTGQKDVVSNMQSVNKSFDEAKKRFQELKLAIGKGGLNTPELQTMKLEYEKTRLEIIKLRKAQQELTNEGKAYANAERIKRDEEKKSRAEAKLTLTEYQKLSKQLTELRNKAKDVGVTFGVESQQFKKAAEEANRLDAQIKKIDASLGQFQRNVGNYPKSVNVGSLSQTAINQLKASGLGDVLANQIDKAKGKAKELDNQFDILKNRLRETKTQGTLSFNNIELEIIQNRIEAEKLNREIRRTQQQISGLGGIGKGVFGGLKTNITQMMGAFGVMGGVYLFAQVLRGAFNTIKEFDKANTDLAATMGKTRKEIVALTEDAKRLGATTKFTATEVSGLQKEFAKFGFNEQEILDATEATLALASATGEDLATSAMVAAQTLRGFGLEASEMGRVTDVMAMSFTKSALDLSNFTESMKYVAPIAKTAGVSIEMATAMLSKLADAGIKGSMAGTSLRRILTEMAKTGLPVNQAFEKIAKSGISVKDAMDEVGRTAQTSLIVLSENKDMVLELDKAYQKAGGSAKKMSDEQLKSLEGRITLMTSAWDGFIQSLNKGDGVLSNAFKKIVDLTTHAINLIKWTSDASSKDKDIINSTADDEIKRHKTFLENKEKEIEANNMMYSDEKKKQVLKQAEIEYLKTEIEIRKRNRDLKREENKEFVEKESFKFGPLKGKLPVIKASQQRALMNEVSEDTRDLRYLENKLKSLTSVQKNQNEVIEENTEATKSNIDAKKEYLNNLQAQRDKEIAINEKKFVQGERNERDYLNKIKEIDVKFYTDKNNFLKGINQEELRDKEQALLAKAKIIKATNDKLFDLDKQEAERQLKLAKDLSQDKLNEILNNPYSSETEKVKAQKEAIDEQLNAQTIFNIQMDLLEKQYNQNSQNNAEERSRELIKIQNELNKKTFELSQTQFKEALNSVDGFSEYLKGLKEVENAQKRIDVLNEKSFNQNRKQIEIEKIDAKERIDLINTELGAVLSKINLFEQQHESQQLTNEQAKEYNRLLKERYLLEQDKAFAEQNYQSVTNQPLITPSSGNTEAYIRDNLLKYLNLDESKYGDILGNVIASSFDLANTAMQGYFDAERQRIEQSKQLAYERIDLEKKQLLNQAQSAGERESIERQTAEKKKQADKEAGEKLKKVKKTELQISLATELANIAVAAASNPLNGVTFGGAGIAMYGLLSGLALAKYAVNLANINKAQFGRGGLFGRGGKLTGPSHSQNNGMPVVNPKTGETQAYLEGDEGIINKRSMKDNNVYSVVGTPSQIASKINTIGGGVDWFGGASLEKFMNGGTYLGSNVQPPVFRSYYNNRNNVMGSENQQTDVVGLQNSIAELRDIVLVESRKKVVINPNEMEDYQKNKNKQSEIATL